MEILENWCLHFGLWGLCFVGASVGHFSSNKRKLSKKGEKISFTTWFFLLFGLFGILLMATDPFLGTLQFIREHTLSYDGAIKQLQKFDKDGWDTWNYANDKMRDVPFKPVTYFINMDKFHDEVDDFLGEPFFIKHGYYWQRQGNPKTAKGFDAGLIDHKRKWKRWQNLPVKDECKPTLDHLLELIYNVETYIEILKEEKKRIK